MSYLPKDHGREYWQPPWDSPGLPPRLTTERCSRHKWCAYRDDDPARCAKCHALPAKCTCDQYPLSKGDYGE